MNEEEKKVVGLLQHCQNTYIEDTLVTRLQLTTKEAKILLNLVDKQQKEIESRLKEIDSLYKMMSAKDDEIETLKESQLVLYGQKKEIVGVLKYPDDVISKDKIKEKIKYYHKQREKAETEKINGMFVNYIDCLEELLGD